LEKYGMPSGYDLISSKSESYTPKYAKALKWKSSEDYLKGVG